MNEAAKNIMAWIIVVAFISLGLVMTLFFGVWGAIAVIALFVALVLFDLRGNDE